jgi:Amt family ammonium transporter
MLEGGLVRSKNVTMQMTKNIALFSLAAIMYWLMGYNLMYPLGDWAIEGYFSGLASRSGACSNPSGWRPGCGR